MDPIKKLDEQLWNILKRKRSNQYELDLTYKKVQDRVGDTIGPLGKLWVMVERVRTADDDVDLDNLPTTRQLAGAVEKLLH